MNPIVPYHIPYKLHLTKSVDVKRLRSNSRRKLNNSRSKSKKNGILEIVVLCTDEAGTLGSAISQIMNITTDSISTLMISSISSTITDTITSSSSSKSASETSNSSLDGTSSNQFNHSRISRTQTITSAVFLSLFFFIATIVALELDL